MNTSKLLDVLSEVAEMNRFNGIVPEGQEGQLLISAGLMAVADSIDGLTASVKDAEYTFRIESGDDHA